jgi:hypothetical protein
MVDAGALLAVDAGASALPVVDVFGDTGIGWT